MQTFTLPKYLQSLSISSMTDGTATLLISEGFDTIDKISAMSPKTIAEVGRATKKTIGTSRANKIYESLHSVRVQELLALSHYWFNPETKVEEVSADVKIDLRGKNVVFTGTAPIARADLKALLVRLGANVQSSVNSKTDILFLSDLASTTGKAKEARDLGSVLMLPYSELI